MQSKKLNLLLIFFLLVSLFTNLFISIPVVATDYIVDGDRVYIDDEFVYLSVSPHTIIESTDVEFNLISKKFSGDIDVVFGINSSLMSPKNPRLWNGTDWIPLNKEIIIVNQEFRDFDRWYLLKNVNINQDVLYKLKLWINIVFNTSGKYFFGVKRSSDPINDGYYIDPWWDSNWDYFTSVTVESGFIDTDLVNFTLYVPLSTDIYNKSNNAASIRFVDIDNATLYDFDIEAADNTNGVVAWVKVPRLDDAVDTVFLCYYGNVAAGNASDPVSTWSNYNVVSYMKDLSTTSVRDYTGSPWHNFTKSGGAGHPAMIAGKINYAQDFELSGNDVIYTSDHDELSFVSGGVDTSFSMMFWLKLEGGGDVFQSLANKVDYGASTHREYIMYLYTGADPSAKGYNVRLYDNSSGGYIQARAFDAVNYSSGDWHFITITYSGNTAPGGISIYHNGTNSTTNTTSSGVYTDMENKDAYLYAGRYSNGDWDFDGIMDEFRISRGYCWNASWVKAEFHSTNMSSSFLTYGSEVARGTPGNFSVNTSGYTQLNLTWTVDITHDYVHIRRSTTGYPPDRTSGTLVYNSTSIAFNDSNVSSYTTYYYSAWSFNSTSSAWSAAAAGDWNHTGPLDPSNIVAWIKGTGLNITWNYGTRSNQTVLVYKNNSYPASVSDGTILYNGTNRFYNDTSYTTSRRYRLYSWNDTVRLFSSGVDVPWGALIINCYNESSGLGITFDVLISSADGSQVYTATGCTNPRIINISQCPQGAGVSILVSSTGYNDRVYYLDIYTNQFYFLNAYLPPIVIPGGGAEPDCVQRPYIDSVTITNPAVDAVIVFTHTLDEMINVEIYNNSLYGSYGGWIFVPSDNYTYNTAQVTINESVLDANTTMARVNYYYIYCEGDILSSLYTIQVVESVNVGYTIVDIPVSDVYVVIKKYINATGTYETISSLYTDGNGYINIYLIPGNLYKVFLNKSGYNDSISNYIPTPPNAYGQTEIKIFKINLVEAVTPPVYLWSDYITFTAERDNATSIIYVNYTDAMTNTTNWDLYIYQIGPNSTTWVLNTSWNGTNSSFNLSLSVAANATYYVVVFHMNHSYFGYHTETVYLYCYHGKITSTAKINALFNLNYRYNPFGWINTCMLFVIVGCFFGFERKNTYMIVFLIGFILLFLNVYIGFSTVWSVLAGGVFPVFLIFVGILMLVRDRRRYHI